MYAPQGVQWTGTNRPRTCPTHHHCPHGNQQTRATEQKHRSRPHTAHPHNPTQTRVGMVRCSGGHSGGETPGPIPNPEAKPSSADGTATARSWESRTPPEHPTTPTTHTPGAHRTGGVGVSTARTAAVVRAVVCPDALLRRSALRSARTDDRLIPNGTAAPSCPQPAPRRSHSAVPGPHASPRGPAHRAPIRREGAS